ncbi:MAG: GNAT family N-acetyltransferase [Planctomycetaceae bacterium]|nr:GNAT family N-acetyltransferase [Planctomycetaceae bacterium]
MGVTEKLDDVPPGTDRLAFREWNDDDLDRFHAICSDPQVMKFVGDGQAWSRDRTGRFIHSAKEMFREHGYCQWALIHKVDGELIGYCGFVNSDDAPEIGWRLAPEYWGKGLATEAARAVLKHGIETLGFQRVIATVQAANVASIRIIEKLGMTQVERFDRDGREVLVYSADAGRLTSG